MKIILVLLFTILLVSFNSCNNSKEEEKLDEISYDDVLAKGEKLNSEISKIEQKINKRKASGDTIAKDWKELKKLIPDIPGYNREEPNGNTLFVDNTSYSTLSIQFSKDKNNTIDIDLFDYNIAINLMFSVSAWRSQDTTIERNNIYQKIYKFKDIPDSWFYEEYNKEEKIATCAISLNDRYYLTVSGTEQENIDFVKSIALSIINNGKSVFSK
jgi:hypothetical protein